MKRFNKTSKKLQTKKKEPSDSQKNPEVQSIEQFDKPIQLELPFVAENGGEFNGCPY